MSVKSIANELREARLPGILPLLVEVAADVHARPEIRFEEVYAAERLCGVLEGTGFDVQRGFAGLETAFVARWSTPGAGEAAPTVAIFCEYDALEGLGHACGHNLIAGCGLGAGILVKTTLEEDPGAGAHLVVVGSPGEEGAAGKVPMIEGGVLDGVDAAMMIHPAGADAVGGGSLSRVALDVSFHGRASHAAAAPERGINAVDAATLSLTAIGLLRQQLTDDVRIHSIIEEGGQAPNIIPELTRLRCFVRAADNYRLLSDAVPKVKHCFEGAALATGCSVDIAQKTPPYLSLDSNPVLTGIAREAFNAVGRSPRDATGTAGAGSTDMGNVSHVVPAIHPMICLQDDFAPHTRDFADAAGDRPRVEPVIADGSVILAATALALFGDPDLLGRVREAFDAP